MHYFMLWAERVTVLKRAEDCYDMDVAMANGQGSMAGLV
jgi:hypothetical protein